MALSSTEAPTRLAGDRLRQLWEGMLEIREFEDMVMQLYAEGEVAGTTHLCQGQEAICVGFAAALREGDQVLCTYRGHGHSLARGLDMRKALAEITSRRTGVAKGKGGSMHLTDVSLGLMGSSAIVGAHLPIAVGCGLAAKWRHDDSVVLCVFGDGAANIGAFHEALNMAGVWRVPVVFLCENNLYGEFSRIDHTTAVEDLAVRASGYGMPGETVDGNDIEVVVSAARRVVERARSGEGPTLIECKTYRHKGHSRSDPAKYRPAEEVEAWFRRDPVLLLENLLAEREGVARPELESLRRKVRERVRAVADQVRQDPFPEPADLLEDVYAS